MSAAELTRLLARKRLLIFDLDGTLVDSSPLHARAFSGTFARYGVSVDYAGIAGMTTEMAVDRLVADAAIPIDLTTRAALVADKRRRALDLVRSELTVMKGAREFLGFAANHFRLALCTSGSRRSVDVALACVSLDGTFDPLVTGNDVTRGKPDPEGYELVLARAGVDREDALVFEDAFHGLAAARSAGIDVIQIVPEGAAQSAVNADWSAMSGALGALVG